MKHIYYEISPSCEIQSFSFCLNGKFYRGIDREQLIKLVYENKDLADVCYYLGYVCQKELVIIRNLHMRHDELIELLKGE